ncbi:MAG: TVP38/TMEM64 family protein [Anaerolineae bacterium]
MNKSRNWLVYLVLILLLVGLVALPVWNPRFMLSADQDRLQDQIKALGLWGPVAIVGLQIVQVFLFPVPGQFIQAASGYLFGPWLGVFYAMSGLVAGSLFLFLVARRLGRPLIAQWVDPTTLARFDHLAQRGGAPILFLLWLVPCTPDDLVCVVAGFTPMPTSQFLVLMVLGRLPGVLASVWVGSGIARFDRFQWGLLLAGVVVGGLLLWQWRGRLQDMMIRLVEWIGSQTKQL